MSDMILLSESIESQVTGAVEHLSLHFSFVKVADRRKL